MKKYFSKEIIVNCWFCMSDSKVPKGNKNCWTCPNCEQYNGFNADGDYNIPIPSQFDENMNYGIGAIKNKEHYQNENVYFCNICLEKQSRKIELLNRFIIKNDCYNELDYRKYKTSLEQQFNLCFACESRVNDQINSKNNVILSDYIEWSAKQKRKKSNKEKRKFSIMKQLNIFPVFLIISCFLLQIIVHSHPFFPNRKSSILNFLIQHENKLNILSFLIVFIITKFAFCLRPSIALQNTQLLLIVLVILYNYYWIDDIGNYNDDLRIMKSPVLLVLICLLIKFLWNFIMLIRALSYSKYYLMSNSPEKIDFPNNDKLISNNRFIPSNFTSTTNRNSDRLSLAQSRYSNSNLSYPMKTSCISLKPSKLNFVRAPQTVLSLKDFSDSQNGTPSYSCSLSPSPSSCSRSSSVWNFDSVSQCLSTGNNQSTRKSTSPSVYSRQSSNSFLSAHSQLSERNRKEISFSYSKVLFKYFFGAIFGIGLNLILVLLLAHFNIENFNIENYLYYK